MTAWHPTRPSLEPHFLYVGLCHFTHSCSSVHVYCIQAVDRHSFHGILSAIWPFHDESFISFSFHVLCSLSQEFSVKELVMMMFLLFWLEIRIAHTSSRSIFLSSCLQRCLYILDCFSCFIVLGSESESNSFPFLLNPVILDSLRFHSSFDVINVPIFLVFISILFINSILQASLIE